MKRFSFFIISTALVVLSGCASYRASQLSPLPPHLTEESETIPGLVVGCKRFSRTDCDAFLDRDVLRKGYQPVELTLYNKTDKTYLFSTKNLSLPSAPVSKVASKVKTSTATRVTTYAVGSLFFPLLIIPAIVDGICSHSANKRLSHDFESKAQDNALLPPNAYLKTIVFIPEQEFSPQFTLTLIEQPSQALKTLSLVATY